MLACVICATVLFAGVCGVAEARTIYTVAGSGGLPPPEVGEPPLPATAISLDERSSVARLPGGDFLIFTGQRTLVLDVHGMVRAVEPTPGPPVATVGVVRVMPDGSTVRIAGTGRRGHSPDGVPAAEARLVTRPRSRGPPMVRC